MTLRDWILLSVFGLCTLWGSLGSAEPFDWERARVRTTSYPEFDGGWLTLREGILPEDALARVRLTASWSRAKDGEAKPVELLELTCVSGDWWELSVQDDGLRAEHPACEEQAADGLLTVHHWRWDSTKHRFDAHSVSEYSPYDSEREALQQLLDADDLVAARLVLDIIDGSNGSGYIDQSDEVMLAFFHATYRAARKAHDAGDSKAAAEAFYTLFFSDPPVLSSRCIPSDGMLVIRLSDGACQRFNQLPNNQTVVQRLNDAAYFLDREGYHSEAVGLLEEIIVAEPRRLSAHLNLADALWATSQEADAKVHYELYLQLLEEDGRKTAPAYVRERLGE